MKHTLFFLIFFTLFIEENHGQTNLLQNSSFEDSTVPSTAGELTFGVTHTTLLRCTGFFDDLCQTSNPNIATATPIPNFKWFERGTSQFQVRNYVDTTKAHSGNKSLTMFNIGGSTSDATATYYWYHNLAQKIPLENNKKYEFKFFVQRDLIYNGASNNVTTLRVGLVSSKNAKSATDYTIYQEVTIPNNENWNEIKVIFDLPGFISSNPNTDFRSSAVFIAMKTSYENGYTIQAKINIDDITLTEANILQNSGFEDAITPSTNEITYGVAYNSVLRCTGFFDAFCQTTNPDVTATTIPNYTWYERGTSQNQVRDYVEQTISHTGNNSITIYNVGGSTSNATATSYWYHNLAQKVSLDDSKTYEFKFYVQRDTLYRGVLNTVSTLRVGIVSSTDAASGTNSTYYKDVTIPWNQEWNEIKVTFNLPAIITSNVGKSFNSCAVFIAMQTGWNGSITTQAKVNIDDLSLTEFIPKEFKIYDAIHYSGKPDLSSFLSPVNLIYESALTKIDPNTTKVVLDMDKIAIKAQLASNSPHTIVTTDIEDWYGDQSVSSEVMASRFNTMFNVFRNLNNDVLIGNYGLAPSALCVLRYYDNGSSDETTLLNSWRTANEKRWKSSEVVDILFPAVYIAQPDINSWKKDLETTVTDIKRHTLVKKIIVYLWPQYYNKSGSPYYKKFIDSQKWTQMLEAIYEICDGVVIWSGNTDENEVPVNWTETRVQDIWSATQNFILENKCQTTIKDTDFLRNGGFENQINPSVVETLNEIEYFTPLRSTGFFDISQTTNPTTIATVVPDYVWFKRGTSQPEVKTYVENTKFRTGSKSLAIYNVGGSTSKATATSYWYHNLAQRVSLDDTKKYNFKFYVQRDRLYNGFPNAVTTLRVGILSSTSAVPQTNYTYYQDVNIPSNQNWNEINVTFDLPAIITSNVGKSFNSCAVFIAMQTGWDGTKTTQAKVNVDDLSLCAIDPINGVKQLDTNIKDFYKDINIQIKGKEILVFNIQHSISIYDILGRPIFNLIFKVPESISYKVDQSGIYIINIDGEVKKILIE